MAGCWGGPLGLAPYTLPKALHTIPYLKPCTLYPTVGLAPWGCSYNALADVRVTLEVASGLSNFPNICTRIDSRGCEDGPSFGRDADGLGVVVDLCDG